MKQKILVKFLLAFSLFYVGQSYADCTRLSGVAEQIIYPNMGTVVVSPNLKVGDVIATQTWPIHYVEKPFYCTAGGGLTGSINTALFHNETNNIYDTNVPGVGIQIRRVTDQENIYPYTFYATRDATISIVASNFVVTLYKTQEYVGSGPLMSGLYTWYSPTGTGVSESGLSSYMSENGTIIVSPSCSVISGAQQNVYLEAVNYTQLKKIGSTAGDTSFSIELKCNGGASINVGYDNVSLNFSGTIPTMLSNSDGVLVNEINSIGAKGVGIQVLDSNKKAITFDNKYKVGSLTGPSSGYHIKTDYIARYYRYGSNISTGPVEAKMIFNITYD